MGGRPLPCLLLPFQVLRITAVLWRLHHSRGLPLLEPGSERGRLHAALGPACLPRAADTPYEGDSENCPREIIEYRRLWKQKRAFQRSGHNARPPPRVYWEAQALSGPSVSHSKCIHKTRPFPLARLCKQEWDSSSTQRAGIKVPLTGLHVPQTKPHAFFPRGKLRQKRIAKMWKTFTFREKKGDDRGADVIFCYHLGLVFEASRRKDLLPTHVSCPHAAVKKSPTLITQGGDAVGRCASRRAFP